MERADELIMELNRHVQELEKIQIQQAEQIKTLFNQLNEQKQLVESVHKLATSVELLTNAQQQTEKHLGELANDMDEIKSKPAKRLDSATGTVITMIVTAVVAYMLAQIGLK